MSNSCKLKCSMLMLREGKPYIKVRILSSFEVSSPTSISSLTLLEDSREIPLPAPSRHRHYSGLISAIFTFNVLPSTYVPTFDAMLQCTTATGKPQPERTAVKHGSPDVQREAALAQPARQAAVDERAAVTEAVEQHWVHLEREVRDEVDQLVRHVQQLARREEDVVGRTDVADSHTPLTAQGGGG